MDGIKIKNGGALTTIQDKGRYGAQQTGFGPCGVMDEKSFHIANALLGNKENEAMLEATLLGPEVEFTGENYFVITGADMGAMLDGVPIEGYRVWKAEKGSVLKLGFAKNGVRAYLAFAGGLDVPEVMGSKSTGLKIKMGGLNGRKLEAGDEIAFVRPALKLSHLERRRMTPFDYQKKEWNIRVVLGFQKDYFTGEGINAFFTTPYTILQDSDRMGYRLEGEPVTCRKTVDIISDATVPGAIQIPANGKPIILMAGRQTTGGYAKLGAVISADLPLLAQAGPGNKIRFEQVSVEEAQSALRIERKELKKLERRMNRWL